MRLSSRPIAKNAEAHEVPLTDLALGILAKLPRFTKGDYVFTQDGLKPLTNFSRSKARIDRIIAEYREEWSLSDRAFLERWTLRDLRRTAVSNMARLNIAPHVVEKVANHKTGVISGVAAIYNRYGYEKEKREAMDVWAGKILSLVEKNLDVRF